MALINSFVFLDIETTGLPGLEYNRTKITEISLVACSKAHLATTKYNDLMRVLHKLTLCIYPAKRISDKSEEITGLSNELLEHESKFCENTGLSILSFIRHLQSPCVLIAHNGKRFDFPILKRELIQVGIELPDELLVADSLEIFKNIDAKEEFEKAEASFIQYDNKEKDKQFSCNNQISIEDDLAQAINILANEEDDIQETEEKVLDEFIQTELEAAHKENISNGILNQITIKQEKGYDFQKENETTPVKCIPAAIPGTSKMPFKPTRPVSRDEVTPSTNENSVPENKKRPRDFNPKSRRDLFGAKKYFKLTDVYERCFNSLPNHSHYAEDDVISLLKCAIAKNKDFIQITEQSAIPFKDIKPLGKH